MNLTEEEKRERNRIAVRKYIAANLEKIKAARIRATLAGRSANYSKTWRERHPEKYRVSCAKHNGTEKHRVSCKKWYLKKVASDPKALSDRLSAWRAKNPTKWRAIMRKSKRRMYHRNPIFRLQQLVSGSIRKSVKKNGAIKSNRTSELLATSPEVLRQWLESQFRDGMSWGNMGRHGWHIDHVKPISSFDLSEIEQQKKCFHYSNLQPLWWWENLQKGSKCN